MKKIALAVALSTSMFALMSQAALADYTLNIIHINDWHSRIEPINKYDSTCSSEDEAEGKCFGGAARLVTAVRQAREKYAGTNLLFLNAGDNFQGSLFYTTYKGSVEAEFLNLMKTDAMAVGNHEFDDGEPGLATFLDAAKFPVLSANVLPSYKSVLGDRVKPSVVLEVGGEKIGIVGAVANDTDELSQPGPNVLIVEDVAAITPAVKALEEQGVNKIIALTHVGYPRDLAVIAKIPGVDVVVGGHSHTLLSNTDDHAAGPYPTWVDNPEGYKVPVVQAQAYSKYLGDVTVTFDDNGVVTEASGDPVLLDASIAPDETVAARIKELGAPIEELKSKRIAEAAEPIDGSRETCRAQECQMGNLVSDAILDRVRDQGIQVAIQNGGGLRASIDGGEITMGEVLTVLPFQNTLATFQLKGSDIVASLESGVSQIEDGAGRFPQVAGLRYSFDVSKPANEGRISDVQVKEDGQWQPIDEDRMYGVVSNNFMRSGGDGYKLFASNAENAYDYGPGLEEVVADYLMEHQPYQPYTDGRITKVEAMAMEEEAEMKETAMEETKEEKVAQTVMTPELPETSMKLTTEPPSVEATEGESMMEMEGKSEEMMEGKSEEMMDDKAGMMESKMHTIVAGDNFWDLAIHYYGDGTMWRKLADANPGVSPHGLQIGADLNIPPAN